nr:hypothetical protein [Chloroflexia bacterium]
MRKPAAISAALAMIFSSLVGIGQGEGVQAADLAHVSGWATVGSVTPAAGCALDASVEVWQDGVGVADVSVGVNLVHDGEIVSADWGMTNGDGLAFMGVDTSWAAAGYEAWLDVLVGGVYAGGMPISITDTGGCADNPDMVEIGAAVAVAGSSEVGQAWSAAAPISSDFVDVGVPTYVQQRNLSCEYAALVIAMGAYGTWISEYEFDARVGWSENTHWGYRGDITGW